MSKDVDKNSETKTGVGAEWGVIGEEQKPSDIEWGKIGGEQKPSGIEWGTIGKENKQRIE